MIDRTLIAKVGLALLACAALPALPQNKALEKGASSEGLDMQEARAKMPGVATTAQLPAAVSGIGMMTYTAALLSSTSAPYWSVDPELRAAKHASSAKGITWAAAQVGVYADLYRAWIDATGNASAVLRSMLEQRVRLGLSPGLGVSLSRSRGSSRYKPHVVS